MTSILQLEHMVWQAVLSKDGEQVATLFSDDYIEVTADGRRELKDSIVETSPQVDDIESYVRHLHHRLRHRHHHSELSPGAQREVAGCAD